jgi:phosphonoacetate hydrolase
VTARQRVLVAMIDGLDPAYLAGDEMPRLRVLGEDGLAAEVNAVLPTVTNANNVSICCAAWPSEHGITGNSYLNPDTGEAEYMESADSLNSPTILQRVVRSGGHAALLTAKVKTVGLLGRDATLAIAAEAPSPDVVDRYGPAPDIYSAEINHWLWTVAIDLLANRPELDLLYVHTTDFPMHAWAPGAPESDAHLGRLDELIAEAVAVSSDIALFAAADHGMGYKTRVWDLYSACQHRDAPIRYALSAERDRYLRHHRTFGGTAWVWLNHPDDGDSTAATILGLEGVESIHTRAEAAERYHLDPARIGDLVILGDEDTVFGELPDDQEHEHLSPDYRSHGSLHEQRVPLYIHNSPVPLSQTPQSNKDLLTPLLDGWLGGIDRRGRQAAPAGL